MGKNPVNVERKKLPHPLIKKFLKEKRKSSLRFYRNGLEPFNYWLVHTKKMTLEKFIGLAKRSPEKSTEVVKEYALPWKERYERGELASSSVWNVLSPIQSFLKSNYARMVDWTLVRGMLPKVKSWSSEGYPTKEQIRLMLHRSRNHGRDRAYILVSLSAGLRVGAWPKLRREHFTPLNEDGIPVKDGQEVFAAELKTYNEDAEEYRTFITREAWDALEEYWKGRGKVGPRDYALVKEQGEGITVNALQTSMARLLEETIRKEGEKVGRNWPFKQTHGFRKFFDTLAMPEINNREVVNALEGVFDARVKSYNRTELFPFYKLAVRALTISSHYGEPKADASEVAELKKRLDEQEGMLQALSDMMGTSVKLNQLLDEVTDRKKGATAKDDLGVERVLAVEKAKAETQEMFEKVMLLEKTKRLEKVKSGNA